ncbi:MAG: hypothetical protein HYT80_09390 [Euryarchaeota archaeon]|nr:hypothetical protein [Euryarchaeota archaeon]
MAPGIPPVLAFEALDALPPVVLGIIVVVIVFFVIKSLIKFAIIAGAVGLVVFIAWTQGWLPF